MNETWKDKIVNSCSVAVQKHPFLKPVILLYLTIMLALFKCVMTITGNLKRLVSVAVLVIFYTISCSFCAPVFVLNMTDTVTETKTQNNQNIQKEAEDIHGITLAKLQETEEEIVAESVQTPYENPEVESDDDIENYSIDEILENNAGFEQNNAAENDDADDWKVILINKQHPIPEDYEFTLGTITGNLQCDERIIPELLEMLQAAKDEGISLLICSPYRDLNRQQMLFDRKITNYMNRGLSYLEAYKLSSQAVTVPGASEHQVGLALDIYTDSYKALDEGFGDTPAGIWLSEHCSEYGFILRYPKDKEYITGIEYEPWHFRYVGKDVAAVIAKQGITLEEFNELY